jgi:GT2 family glycosyltransferase
MDTCEKDLSEKEPEISFIVPVYNCVGLTRDCLDSLVSTVEEVVEYEILVIDDCSEEVDLGSFLNSLTVPFRVVRNEMNRGFAYSCNLGVSLARGEQICFLNNDLVLTENWLNPMRSLLARVKNIGAVGNVQMNPSNKLVDHAGVFFDLEGMPTHAHKNRKFPPRGPFRERSAVTAACLLMNKAVFEEMGGFSEDYRNGMEDIDLCVRLKIAGYTLLVSHESIIQHHVSQSPGRHQNNDENSALFKKRWSQTTAVWGRDEWAMEYLRRYARFWWRLNFKQGFKAVIMVLTASLTGARKAVGLSDS